MEKKVCRRCKENKGVDKYWSAGIKNGKKHLRQTCITCYGKVKKDYIKRKREWYNNLKKNLSCNECGYSKLTHKSFSSHALQFHHHNDDKSFTVADYLVRGYSRKKITQEINKCKVLCSRCHAEEHAKSN
jgi:hypothetical protein